MHQTKKSVTGSLWQWLPLFMILCVGTATAADVTSFTLVNAATDTDIQALTDGATINLADVGSSLNVRANTNPATVTKVTFNFDGTTKTESVAPYALFGDSSGDYAAGTIAVGSHTLKATAYDGTTAGPTTTIAFTVVDDGGGTVDPPGNSGDGTIVITGEKKRWHKITLTLDGPWASETGTPNPFLDYRMDVTFTKGSLTYTVPGYFAADGDAANTSATSGIKWRAHLSPDLTGTWTYTVSFKSGTNCAVNGGGSNVAPYNGKTGTFTIAETDKTGRDLRAKGRLQYVGKHHLQFKGNGEYFLKEGPDAPENFLAYTDFDGPFKTDGQKDNLIKSWSPHIQDWKSGDPTWQNGKGKGMIGAINYLASEGLNSFSFIPMNIIGDDRNVFPYLDYNERYRMDCSRLAQWEIVFEHGTNMGFYLHFKTQETENELLLDNGNVGVQRKLYYRELIARFSHHLALNWNLGEEINNATTAQKVAWAQYFYDNDPYHHHIVIHNGSNHYELMGDASKLTGFSLQTSHSDFSTVHDRVKDYLDRSDAAGKPWVVACDEPGDASYALRPDDDPGNSHEDGRKNGLWGSLMAGGTGCEWYFGYKLHDSDLTCEDFRSRDSYWDYCRYALQFFRNNNIPYQDMVNDDSMSTAADDYCFYKAGDTYVVYLKNGGTTNLKLGGVSGTYTIKWYDPRNGGSLKNGSKASVSGGADRALGNAPNNTGKDWVILVRKSGTPVNNPPSAGFATPANGDTILQSDPLYVKVDATDSDGSVSNVKLYLDGTFVRQENVTPYEWSDAALQNLSAGPHTLKAVATDDDGATSETTITITVDDGSITYIPIPGKIETEDYRGGGEGVGYHDTTAGNAGSAYRTDDVDIQVTGDTGGGYNVGWIANGEWLAYDVDIASAGNYTVTCRVASKQTSNKSLHLEIDGADVTGPITFNTGGAGWQSWQDVVVNSVALPAGQHTLKIAMDASSFNVNYVDIQPETTTVPPVVSFATPANGDNITVGTDLYVKVNASDSDGSISNVKLYVNDAFVRQENKNPYEWNGSKDALLANMQQGTYVLKAVATDNDGLTTTKQITITVGSTLTPPEAIIMQDAYLENGTLNNNTYLKVEPSKRISYIQFNVTALQGAPSSAKLKLTVSGDPGNGTIRIYEGSHSNWTETNLSTSNAPAAGAEIASRTGSWVAGTTYEFELKSMIPGDGDYSIVIKMDAGGNDAWFGSDESAAQPVIEITQ